MGTRDLAIMSLAFGCTVMPANSQMSADSNNRFLQLLIGTSRLIHKAELANACGKRPLDWVKAVGVGIGQAFDQVRGPIVTGAGIDSASIGPFAVGVFAGQAAAAQDELQGINLQSACDAVSNAPGWQTYLQDLDALAH